MTNYVLRDEKGIMKAKFSATMAPMIFARALGHWRAYKSTSSKATSVFEFDEDSIYTMCRGIDKLELYIWKGDILIPC